MSTNYSTINGEKALRQDVLDTNGEITERIYIAFHNNYKYTITILSDIEQPSSASRKVFTENLEKFEELVQSFRFLSGAQP
jgi:mevalonate kinase